MVKYDSFYDTQCARVSHASRQISYLWLELKHAHPLEIHKKREEMTNVDNANLSGKQHCSYCAHYAGDNNTGRC